MMLYHGAVTGATMANGQLVEGGISIGREDLELVGADYYALGDIHLAQQIPGLPAYYPGSAYPVNWGEVDQKGFNLVELNPVAMYADRDLDSATEVVTRDRRLAFPSRILRGRRCCRICLEEATGRSPWPPNLALDAASARMPLSMKRLRLESLSVLRAPWLPRDGRSHPHGDGPRGGDHGGGRFPRSRCLDRGHGGQSRKINPSHKADQLEREGQQPASADPAIIRLRSSASAGYRRLEGQQSTRSAGPGEVRRRSGRPDRSQRRREDGPGENITRSPAMLDGRDRKAACRTTFVSGTAVRELYVIRQSRRRIPRTDPDRRRNARRRANATYSRMPCRAPRLPWSR